CARRSARRILRTPSRGRSAATSRCRCPTTSCTAPTRPSRPSARSRSGSMTSDLERNVAVWTKANADYTDGSAASAWARNEIAWGMFHVPESELNVLGDVELGCGTAHFSAWPAKRGARVVGVDPTPAQLETARRLQRDTGIEFDL